MVPLQAFRRPEPADSLFLGAAGRIRLQREGFRGQIDHTRVAYGGGLGYRPGRGKYCVKSPFEPDPTPPRLTL